MMPDTNIADTAQVLLRDNKRHACFDYIFSNIDRRFREKKFEEIDTILREINTRQYDVDILIAFLSVTYPGKVHLKQRASFYDRVKYTLAELIEGLD